MIYEKIYFTDSKGFKLCGILSNPTEDKTKPIIILAHGFGSSKESSTYAALEKVLNEQKISTLRFDFFGHGESEGDFADITISEGVDDILGAIAYLKQNNYQKIGLCGASFGGITSINAAAKTNDLFVLALKSPVSNYKEKDLQTKDREELAEWKEKGFKYYVNSKGVSRKLNYAFFEDYDNNNGYEVASKIKIPVFIVHGDADEVVPIEQSLKIKDIFPNCQLAIVKGANHRYTEPKDFQECQDLLSGFLIKICQTL